MQTFYASQSSSEDLDYTINFAAELGTDTIATVAWSCAKTGIALGAQSNTATTATVWLSGGTPGVTYIVKSLATTVGGREIGGDISMYITSP